MSVEWINILLILTSVMIILVLYKIIEVFPGADK